MIVGYRSQTGDEQPPTSVGGIIQSELLRFHRLLAVASSWMTNIASEKEKTATIPPDSATWMLPRLLTSLPVLPRAFIFRIKRGNIRYAG